MKDPYRAERIAKLAQHPAWPDLIQEVVQQETDYWTSLTKKLRAGAELDAQQIREKRAFFRGMHAVAVFPERGQKAIEKHLEKEGK